MMTRRAKIIAAIVTIGALAGGYAAYWFTVAAQLEEGIDDWTALQRQNGLTLDFERTPITGFPFSFRAIFRRPHIAGVLGGQKFDWQGSDVEAVVSPLNLRAMTLHSPGHHSLDLGAGPAAVEASALSLMVAFGGAGGLSSASLTFADAKLTLPDQQMLAAGNGTAMLTLPAAAPKADSDPSLKFAISGKDLKLPEGMVLLTGDPLAELQLSGAIKGPFSPAPLRQALAAWRDAGGTVELSSFAAAQATLSLSGSATIALDADLQPIVAADVKARGLAPTIDLLESQRRIYPEDALKMKLFVKGAERDAPGGTKEVATGLTIQGGYLSWGPFKLAHIQRIEWP